MSAQSDHRTIRVPVADLVPGMVLSSDVLDRSGRFLLGGGAIVEACNIRAFRAWGIEQVEVAGLNAGSETPPPPAADPAALDSARQVAARRFRHANCEHPVMGQLFEFYVQRLARERS
jgi:hypothetical protein